MEAGLGIAGFMCLVLALGHATIGLVFVLPNLTAESPTPRFTARMTAGMMRVTWHLVTVFVLASGGLLLNLTFAQDAGARTITLRWFAAMWATAMVTVVFTGRRSLRDLFRLPVWLLFGVVAVLCWVASS